MKRPRLVVLLVAALTLGACTTGSSVPTPVAKNGARGGGTIRVGITRPASVEPSGSFETASQLVSATTCDTLVQTDVVTGELRPALAEAWVISDEGKRFTIKLRKGLRSHAGRKVTASDVVFSLNRLASADNASYEARLLQTIVGYDLVHGDKATDDEHKRTHMSGMKVLEGSSLEIKLTKPNADFMRVFTHIATAPVPKAAAERDPDGFARLPDCVGPYALAGPWSPSDPTITVRRDPRYKGRSKAHTAGGAGYAVTIEFHVFADQAAAVAAYEAGQVDVTTFGADLVPRARARADDFEAASRGGIEMIGLPTTQRPFDDPRVRRAMSMALDRRRVIDAALGGAGAPATGFVPPTVADVFRPDECGPATPAAEPDVAGAVQLVRDAGVALEGVRFKLYFNDELGSRPLVDEVAAQWRSAFGMDVVPAPLTWEAYLSTARSSSGFDAPFRASWRGDHVGPDAYLGALFHSATIGVSNLSRFSDSTFDRALDRGAREATDETARRLDYRLLARRACEAMPAVPVAFVHGGALVRRSTIGTAVDKVNDVATGRPALRELFVR